MLIRVPQEFEEQNAMLRMVQPKAQNSSNNIR
jgi:hypothetical protein